MQSVVYNVNKQNNVHAFREAHIMHPGTNGAVFPREQLVRLWAWPTWHILHAAYLAHVHWISAAHFWSTAGRSRSGGSIVGESRSGRSVVGGSGSAVGCSRRGRHVVWEDRARVEVEGVLLRREWGRELNLPLNEGIFRTSKFTCLRILFYKREFENKNNFP
jgi:hypothetical protein